MLPKKKRVTKELFQQIMKTGKMLSGPLFVFRYINSPIPCYAVVAPKSVAKSAVDRNRLRRHGYSALRVYPYPSVAGIFFYKKGSMTAKPSDIKNNIQIIFGKI